MNKLDQTKKDVRRARLDNCAERWGVTIKDRIDFKDHAETHYLLTILLIAMLTTMIILAIINLTDEHYEKQGTNKYSFSQTYTHFIRGCVDKKLTGNLTLLMPADGNPVYLTCNKNGKFQYTYYDE